MKAARRRLERFQAQGKVRHRAGTTCATGFFSQKRLQRKCRLRQQLLFQ